MAGTFGGFLASIIPNIGTQQLFTTCILAFVGAVISFFTTILLRKLLTFLKTCKWKSKYW